MSYTMTFELPQKTADYASKQGARLSRELNAIFVAIIEAKMLCDDSVAGFGRTVELSAAKSRGDSAIGKLAGIARNVVIEEDHGILARAAMEKYERISR